ncbi:HAMP domain-containing histidine kinase [Xinfangfangia sp. D13-10-4-6]|uniref:sensor histidine kinase n=1 Tax=Pseudogemmobacter hezensis TaxID=2737662 RepID=UPI001551D901|nr:HAMP domain-containing sensor histidine kinase [Pseudogemmobacter hezensis]NPD16826.1 HAMP domain-containing histidine kinase [Pseudogemmobacter hezensis]
MRFSRSIRLRLGLAAVLTITLALVVGGLVLSAMFDRQIKRLAGLDLGERSVMLMAGLRPLVADPGAEPEPDPGLGGDPRYLRPYSGYYWQLEVGGRSYRAQSLWDAVLPLPPEGAPGEAVITTGPGPDGQQLMIHDRLILVGPDAVPVRISVALDLRSQIEAQSLFQRDLVPFLAVLGALLLLASVIQIAVGLRPFRRIRQQVTRLGQGTEQRLGYDMPQEVEPLAREIDALLDERDARITRARHRAADLAHTLKTPLQALMGEAGRLEAAGQSAPARAITQITHTIRQRVDHELGRDRIAGKGVSDPARVARGVVDVLRRTARGAEVAITVDVAVRPLRIDAQDLAEALGALAENALAHARSTVSIRSEPAGAMLLLVVTDDGPGIPDAQIALVTRRGVSLRDEAGSDGLGLALVQEIVTLNEGSLRFDSTPDGLRVEMGFRLAETG